jgi:hypothetical protein
VAETEYTKGFIKGRKYEANRILTILTTRPEISIPELMKLLEGNND